MAGMEPSVKPQVNIEYNPKTSPYKNFPANGYNGIYLQGCAPHPVPKYLYRTDK
jgi:hypothetical protein